MQQQSIIVNLGGSDIQIPKDCISDFDFTLKEQMKQGLQGSIYKINLHDPHNTEEDYVLKIMLLEDQSKIDDFKSEINHQILFNAMGVGPKYIVHRIFTISDIPQTIGISIWIF